MRGLISLLRIGAAALALLAAACGQQRTTDADVGIGTAGYVTKDATLYAALYKPYAQMSALAYTDAQFKTADARACPDAKKLRDPKLLDAAHSARDNLLLADWLDELQKNGWVCLRSHAGVVGCPSNTECAGGLEATGWWRRDCSEMVIAFRGTDRNDRGDWASNLRFLAGGKVFDQYDQVATVITEVVDRIEQNDCRPRRIITTGHSLGGGLAQQAAFAEPRIDYVYAFDPSPLAGFFNVVARKRVGNVEDLGIDRIYESGEVLALTRSLASGLYAMSQCRPRIRTVRFATLEGSRTERHSIVGMTRGLTALAAKAPANAALPTAFERAEECDLAAPEMGG
jgi:hypothetical protein